MDSTEADEEEAISLADAISVWAESAEEDDDARAASLVQLLNYCADATVHVLSVGDAETMDALAETLIPLRVALLRWPRAAELPPYGVFLGCLQALLRNDKAQLTRLAPALDEDLAGALVQLVELANDHDPTLGEGLSAVGEEDPTRGEPLLPQQIAAALERGDLQAVERELAALPEHERAQALLALRRRSEDQVARMPPEQQRTLAARLQSEQRARAVQLQAEEIARIADEAAELATQTLREADGNAARSLAIQIGQAASHYGAGEERGSPYDELAAFLRGVAAILRGTPVPPVPEAYTARIAALCAVADET